MEHFFCDIMSYFFVTLCDILVTICQILVISYHILVTYCHIFVTFLSHFRHIMWHYMSIGCVVSFWVATICWRYLVLFSCSLQISYVSWWKPGKDKTVSQNYHRPKKKKNQKNHSTLQKKTHPPIVLLIIILNQNLAE